MASDLSKVDPNWAWELYQPDEGRPWNRRQAAHLYRRAGFAATSRQLDEAVKKSPAETVQQLLTPEDTNDFDSEMDDFGETIRANRDPSRLSAWWLYRMLHTPDQLLEKTTLFWHGHFATSAAKVTSARLMLDQNKLLRRFAHGKFEEMVQHISRDPAMLIYLDSTTNRKTRPNENYAREVLELFCLGLDQYTEKDIQELARCFTGYEVRKDKFGFNKYQHDRGVKSVFGQSGNFKGDDAVRVVVSQQAAPRFIVRKLMRYFMFDEPQPPSSLVDPLADELREHDFDIGFVVGRILASNLFFSPHSMGRKVRSPVEMGIGLLRALEGRTNIFRLAESVAELGQSPFFPPNVKGWDGGRTWINSSTLLGRANMVRQILLADETKFGDGNLESLVARHGKLSTNAAVDWLLDLLVAVPVPPEVREMLVGVGNTSQGNKHRRLANVVHTISTLPEFQLG